MSANIIDDLKSKYSYGNAIIKLIMVNVFVHLVLLLFGLFAFLFKLPENDYWAFIHNWFYLPSDISLLPYRVWTFFSYMFLHSGAWHLFSNMLVLYVFGQKLNDLLPNQKILPIYLWGGIIGALFFIIGYNIIPAFSDSRSYPLLVGASASVMAVVLATATLNPRGEIRPFGLFSIELQYVALIWILVDLLVTLRGVNPGGALAHLGGAFMGWFFVYLLRKGRDLSKPVDKVVNLFNRSNKDPKNYKKEPQQETLRSKMKVYKGSQKTDYYGSEYGRSFIQKYKDMSKEECLNTILDNIKRSGYDGLTEDEKAFLDRYRDH